MTTDRSLLDAANSSSAANNAAAALVAARAWTAALASPPPPPPSAAASPLLRRLGISKLVREQWNKGGGGGRWSGEEPGAWFDGRVDALEAFVSEAIIIEEEEEEEESFIDVFENGGAIGRESGLAALFAAQRLLPGPLQRPALLLGAADEWRCSQLWRKKKKENVKNSSSSSSSSFAPDWDAFASSFPAGEQARITDGRRKGARPDVRQKVEVSEAVRLLKEFEKRRGEGCGGIVGGGDGDDGGSNGDGSSGSSGSETSDLPLPYLKDLQCSQAHPPGLLDDASPAWASGDEWLGDGADSWNSGRGREDGEEEEGEEKGSSRGVDVVGGKTAAAAAAPPPPPPPPPARRRPPSYRFVYAGPLGASTPWHADVYGSCAWSANLTGWKKWTFLPPRAAPLLYSRFGEETAKWIGGEEGEGEEGEEGEEEDDPVSFPWLGEARKRSFSVLQGPGDAVFVPPAWWHCVENVPEPRKGRPRLGGGRGGGGGGRGSSDCGGNGGGEKRNDSSREENPIASAAAAISINVNFVAGPVAVAAAWEDSVLREHEEELRRKRREEEEGVDAEKEEAGGAPPPRPKQKQQQRRRLASSLPPPLPPLPARQVDGSTLAAAPPAAEGIGMGGFVALALGAAERAARFVEEETRRRASVMTAATEKLDQLSAVALARAAVSARSARRVLLGAASYARRAAAIGEEGECEETTAAAAAAAAAERFLEGLTLAELHAAAEKASAAVEVAAELLGVQAQL